MADLLSLQGSIKRDPTGYKEEFLTQLRHYRATLEIFMLKPSTDSGDFQNLITFVSQVAHCYPNTTAEFPQELMNLLDQHHAVLDSALRRCLVTALVLLRNRGVLDSVKVLPLFFRLFKVQDKTLREYLFTHIIADVKAHNKKGRNEKFNRSIQNFMYSMVADENEASAKRSLAVLTELYRRNLWRDARSVNVIASACFHKSPRVMLAALKFFLGHDQEGDGSDDDGDDQDEKRRGKQGISVAGPSKEDLYKAYHKGTLSSKKKKQRKMERVLRTLKKEARRGERNETSEGFAALQLLHDPQSFSERLFSRLQSCKERFETRLALMQVISRVVGVHRLLVLNFYPFLQKYIMPQQTEVTTVLAALVQAVHDMVPPDVLEPVLRQLVDNFVNDKARPEVMTVGLRTVRELCLRQPLVMSEDLLQDLVMYKKFREKEVSNAARALLSLFREIAPHMLERKDRGRGADADARLAVYGHAEVQTRVAGADLLEKAIRDGVDFDKLDNMDEDDSDLELEDVSGDEEEELAGSDDEVGSDDDEEGLEMGSDLEMDSDEMAELGIMSDSDLEDDEGSEDDGEDDEADEVEAGNANAHNKRKAGSQASGDHVKRARQAAAPESLASLKKKLAEVNPKAAEDGEGAAEGDVPIEYGRILTQEDFDRIRKLKARQSMELAMQKHGLKSNAAKKKENGGLSQRMALIQEQDEDLQRLLAKGSQAIAERKIDPMALLGNHKSRKSKEERLASVLEGRKDREGFGAAAKLKKQKSGGKSNREKERKKIIPIAARIRKIKHRIGQKGKKDEKNFKGKIGRIRR